MRGQNAQMRSFESDSESDPGGQDSAFRQTRGSRLDAQRGGSARQTGGVGMLLRHSQEFGLSDEQQERLEKLRLNHELEKIDLRAAVEKAKVRLRALMRDYDASETDVLAAIDALAVSEADLRKMRFRHLKAARGLLNPDQVGNLKVFHKRHLQEKIKDFNAAKQATQAK